jgi:hypothetical protein
MAMVQWPNAAGPLLHAQCCQFDAACLPITKMRAFFPSKTTRTTRHDAGAQVHRRTSKNWRRAMTRTYNVIDADGHILEPLSLWTDYMDPAFRDRAPRLVRDNDGKERLIIEEKVLGSKKGMGALGAVGARDGTVVDDTMEYSQGKKGGFDPHARIPDMDQDGIDAAFLYPSIGLFAGAVQAGQSHFKKQPKAGGEKHRPTRRV